MTWGDVYWLMFFFWAFLLGLSFIAKRMNMGLMAVGGITGIAWGILLLKETLILATIIIFLNFYILFYALFEEGK